MIEETNFIHLSDESIESVRALCDLVARKSRRNEQTRTMANGIAEYAEHHGFVSRKQAEWLVRNADFHKQPRPEELSDVTYERNDRSPSLFDDGQRSDADPDKLISLLVSVRRELDAIISRLRE